MYPHVVANGENLTVPDIDSDSRNTSANGTSYSAPNTAGAAALFRSVATTASAEETRAAILASTEDVRAQNPNDAQFTGYGYVRTDRLIGLARGQGGIETGSVSTTGRSWTTTIPVTAGQRFGLAISWSQSVIGDASWADLSMFVRINGRSVASSTTSRTTNERIDLLAPSSGIATIEVFADAFENGTTSQDFGFAFYSPTGGASIELYGTGCGRPTASTTGRRFEPLGAGTRFGSTSSPLLFQRPQSRTQILYAQPPLSGSFNIQALLLRFDDIVAVGGQRRWVDLEIDIGTKSFRANQVTNDFAANRSLDMVNVVRRRRVALPASVNPAASPTQFDLIIPLDQAVERPFDPVGGANIVQGVIVEIRTYGNSNRGTLAYPLDAVGGNPNAFTLHANSPNATTGALTIGTAPILGFATEAGTVLPTLNAIGRPAIGGSYTLAASRLPRNAPFGLNLGSSRTNLGGLRLPLDLTRFGAAGCTLHASIDIPNSLTTDANGRATLRIAIPNVPALVGGEVFHQGIAADPIANALGIATTNGLAVRIGR